MIQRLRFRLKLLYYRLRDNFYLYKPNENKKTRSKFYYDKVFASNDVYKDHYSKSPYLHLWTIVLEEMTRSKFTAVLDIGCGPGQLAQLLRDNGIKNYTGIDFSQVAIEKAKSVVKDFSFVQSSIPSREFSKALHQTNYDIVLAIEFLEHIPNDLDVLLEIHKNVPIIASVPNFDAPGHVRFFNSSSEIYERYRNIIDIHEIMEVPFDDQGTMLHYIITGTLRAGSS